MAAQAVAQTIFNLKNARHAPKMIFKTHSKVPIAHNQPARSTLKVQQRAAWSPAWRNPFVLKEEQLDVKPIESKASPIAAETSYFHESEQVSVTETPKIAKFEAVPLHLSSDAQVEPSVVDEAQTESEPIASHLSSESPTEIENNLFRPKITVVGIGGGGCNAINNMIAGKLPGVEFLVCNTDAQSLESSLCSNKLQLGESATGGFGAGSNPEVGRAAAQESVQQVLERIQGSNMVFLTAGMGGGTGTGAAPVIANACRNAGILTVAIVTMPFDFEGKKTRELAQTGLQKLQDQVDTVIVVPNQKLLTTQGNLPLLSAFGVVDDVLFRGIQGVTDLVVRPGLINTDFSDVRRIMQSNSGRGLMGTGEASGEDRGKAAAIAAIEHPLLDDVDVSAARRVLVTITSSSNCSMQEIDTISTTIQDRVNPEALIIYGVTLAKEMGDKLRVSVIATDMAESSPAESQSYIKKERKPAKEKKDSTGFSFANLFRGWL